MNFSEKIPENNTIEIQGIKLKFDQKGLVKLTDIARTSLLNQQAQYAARYADGLDDDYPNFGEGLRIEGNSGNYHDMKIHKDDVEIFISKIAEYKKSKRSFFGN